MHKCLYRTIKAYNPEFFHQISNSKGRRMIFIYSSGISPTTKTAFSPDTHTNSRHLLFADKYQMLHLNRSKLKIAPWITTTGISLRKNGNRGGPCPPLPSFGGGQQKLLSSSAGKSPVSVPVVYCVIFFLRSHFYFCLKRK